MTGLPHSKLAKTLFSSLFIFAILFSVLLPFYWMITTSLKDERVVYQIPPEYWPSSPTLSNYKNAFESTPISKYFLNSLINVSITLILVLLVSTMGAYAISRFRFKYKRVIFGGLLMSQMLPITTLIVPLYVFFGKFDLFNNRFVLILTYVAIQAPIAIFVLVGYFQNIPREIDEAAYLDGCNSFQTLWCILLPLSRPGLLAASVTCTISVWQELLLAMTFTSVDELRPMMAGISASVTRNGVLWGQLNSVGFIACIPMILLFVVGQKYLTAGLTSGALKG